MTIKNLTIPVSISSSEFFENPYPFYDKLRSIHPIYKGNFLKYPGWYVTGYAEAAAILKDTRFKNRIPLPENSQKYSELKNMQHHMMLFKNPPDHKRIRMLVNRAFTPRFAESYRPYINETVNVLLNEVQYKRTMDVVSDFAFPLASLIIAKMLGVPAGESYQFREWAASLIQTIDFTRSRKELTKGNDKAIKLIAYFKDLIQQKKHNPQNDLISMLMKEQQDDRLSDEELLATCILLVIAGHETTVNLISNSILSLLNHPEKLMELKEKPSLIESAVEEFLRYESPTQMTARVASEDIEMNGMMIKKEEHVYILLGAANRDPKKFAHPHVLDITRNPNPHLAFGQGIHFCLGSSLARLEAQIAICTLLQRIPNLQLSTPNVQYRKLIGFRSLTELPVTL
ncbi:cytochrome P450 [Bacillus atrophaeus]|uniref:cytochrome P450 n=1 Tax=Bacillus atrophaeus TaxID=1452 RepID=UPI002E1FEBB2|nr:cytochrome P450 [Bacillus atrophaeus]MED1030168.1 cytochrome P450 [Bacillus atrophaeus]MED1118620.1 cytochrome P450 [Bacillus atrophaeus]MED1132774.1 cytochrome P450 [Bacillus atrophaeus]